MVHFYGLGIPGVSICRGGDSYVRWDREERRPIGLQLEGFLARAVRENPELLDALDVADLRGITLEEIARVRREVAQDRLRRDGTGLTRPSPRLWQAASLAAEVPDDGEEDEAEETR